MVNGVQLTEPALGTGAKAHPVGPLPLFIIFWLKQREPFCLARLVDRLAPENFSLEINCTLFLLPFFLLLLAPSPSTFVALLCSFPYPPRPLHPFIVLFLSILPSLLSLSLSLCLSLSGLARKSSRKFANGEQRVKSS